MPQTRKEKRSLPGAKTAAGVGTAGVPLSIATHNWLALAISAAHYVPIVAAYLETHGGIKGVLGGLWGSNERGYVESRVLIAIVLLVLVLFLAAKVSVWMLLILVLLVLLIL